jgi:hypothetical protein
MRNRTIFAVSAGERENDANRGKSHENEAPNPDAAGAARERGARGTPGKNEANRDKTRENEAPNPAAAGTARECRASGAPGKTKPMAAKQTKMKQRTRPGGHNPRGFFRASLSA